MPYPYAPEVVLSDVEREMSIPRFPGRFGLGDQAAGAVAFRFS